VRDFEVNMDIAEWPLRHADDFIVTAHANRDHDATAGVQCLLLDRLQANFTIDIGFGETEMFLF
jgi:hypothetical protein